MSQTDMQPTQQTKDTGNGRSTILNTLLLNLLLALAWVFLSGTFSLGNFVAGIILGYFSLRVLLRGQVSVSYVYRVTLAMRFLLFFLLQILQSNIIMLLTVLELAIRRESSRLNPAIVAIPLDLKSDLSITLLANVITLTPGTLTLDVSDDRRTLYVHAAFVPEGEVEAFRQHIKSGFEQRIKAIFE